MTLQLYCPPNKQSKAYLVLDAARKGWPETVDVKNYARGDGPAMFWGFVGENFTLIKDLEVRKKDYYFTVNLDCVIDNKYEVEQDDNDNRTYTFLSKEEINSIFKEYNIDIFQFK